MLKRIIVGESGGPTPVIDWTVAGALAEAKQAGIEIYGAINGMEGILNADIKGNIVDLTQVNPMQFVHNGPGAGLKTTRIKPKEDQYKIMVGNLNKLKVDGIIYIGGNDSADQLLGLSKADPGIAAVHAIKTVDNDLPVTHHCPGWGSSALYNAVSIKNVTGDFYGYGVRTKEGINNAPLIVYQVMGRKAGWLAQATAFARVNPAGAMSPDKAPHIILSKEILFDKDKFLSELENVLRKNGLAVVVVQEDLTDKDSGKSIAEVYGTVERDDHGNIQHGRAGSFSPATFIVGLAKNELKVDGIKKVKDATLAPQHLQRSTMLSVTDASEAYMIGGAAVRAILNGESGKSVVLARGKNGNFETALTDLANIARKEKSVPTEYIRGYQGPTQEFIDEYISVIGGPCALPHYSDIVFKPV
jgi:ATP-dependent phosphofructokinase / diphosphate-dependent phosphofructokinase